MAKQKAFREYPTYVPPSLMTPRQKEALLFMHRSERRYFDMSWFPGRRTDFLDDMARRFGVVTGCNVYGFTVTERGAQFAEKLIAKQQKAARKTRETGEQSKA